MRKNYFIMFIIMFLGIFMIPVNSFSSDKFTTVNRVDSFIYMIDYSGSMMMMDKKFNCTKLEVAKFAMKNVNRQIPDQLKFKSKIMTISPNKIVYENLDWDKKVIENKLSNIEVLDEVFGRMSPLYNSILNSQKELSLISHRTAVILVSDGDYNKGKNPKYIISDLYKTNPNLVFHIISVADTENGEKTLKDIQALNKNSIYVNASNLLTDNPAKEFSENVFFGYAKILNGQFDFDKFNLKNDEIRKISIDTEYILNTFLIDNINILGWTDNIGTNKYNFKLSQKRANTAKELINELLFENKSNSELKATGEGKSFLYDNKTKEGRTQNRHINIFFN